MYKAILIDDEEHCTSVLQSMLQRYCPQVEVVATAANAAQGLQEIGRHQPHVVFADIQMPGQSGIDMLASIPSITFQVVFTTAYDQYAIRAIKLQALDYLLKPTDRKELVAAVAKLDTGNHNASLQTQQVLGVSQAIKSNASGIMAIATTSGIEFVKTTEIIVMEADNCYTIIHTVGGKKLVASKTLQYFEDMLADDGHFFRAHKTYLVNLEYIKSYHRGDGGEILLTNGKSILLSKHRKQEFLGLFLR